MYTSRLQSHLANSEQAPQYQPGKPYVPPSATVQKHVFGESTDIYHGYAPEERIAPPPAYDFAPAMAPHAAPDVPFPSQSQTATITVEEPFTEPIPEPEAIEQGRVEPTTTTEQRRFSAPHMEWDATQYVQLFNSLSAQLLTVW